MFVNYRQAVNKFISLKKICDLKSHSTQKRKGVKLRQISGYGAFPKNHIINWARHTYNGNNPQCNTATIHTKNSAQTLDSMPYLSCLHQPVPQFPKPSVCHH